MWRTMASLFLTFLALGWAVVATALCFFYGAGLWRDLFGRGGAFYSAVIAFVVCLGGARALLALADRLIEPFGGPFDERAYRAAPRDAFFADWQRYAADIVRNRRYAFYVRTRQWDKLAALGPQIAAGGPGEGPGGPGEVPEPRRTSAAGGLRPDEVSRGARRTSHEGVQAARAARWAVPDGYE
jgi:hypothetical protein